MLYQSACSEEDDDEEEEDEEEEESTDEDENDHPKYSDFDPNQSAEASNCYCMVDIVERLTEGRSKVVQGRMGEGSLSKCCRLKL